MPQKSNLYSCVWYLLYLSLVPFTCSFTPYGTVLGWFKKVNEQKTHPHLKGQSTGIQVAPHLAGPSPCMSNAPLETKCLRCSTACAGQLRPAGQRVTALS